LLTSTGILLFGLVCISGTNFWGVFIYAKNIHF